MCVDADWVESLAHLQQLIVQIHFQISFTFPELYIHSMLYFFCNLTFDLNLIKVHQKLPGANLQVTKKYNYAVSISKNILPLMIMD